MNTIPVWQYVLSMGIYSIALWIIVDVFRKHVKVCFWFWLLSLATFPLWITLGEVEGWFRWFKILSVLLPTALVVNSARLAHSDPLRQNRAATFFRKDWVLWFLYGILFLNILEATVKDIELGNLPNAIVGMILMITIPFPMKYWKFGGKNKDLILYTTAAWNAIYTTWNLCFVYAEGAAFFGGTICILGVAELYPLIKKRPELYIMARVYTLAAHELMRALCDWVFPTYMNFLPMYSEAFKNGWGVVNLIVALPYLFWYLWQLNTGRAEKSFIRNKSLAE